MKDTFDSSGQKKNPPRRRDSRKKQVWPKRSEKEAAPADPLQTAHPKQLTPHNLVSLDYAGAPSALLSFVRANSGAGAPGALFRFANTSSTAGPRV